MNIARLLLLTTLVLGYLVLNSNLAYAGVAVIERQVDATEVEAEQANIEPLHEPETAGYIGDVLASNDTRITKLGTKVKQELKAKAEMENIDVSVQEEGSVALAGTVQSEAEKIEAQKVASEVEGVNSVENRLIVQN